MDLFHHLAKATSSTSYHRFGKARITDSCNLFDDQTEEPV